MTDLCLSETLGANFSELPICLSDAWDYPPLQDTDKKVCLECLALLMRDRQRTRETASKTLTKWSHYEDLTESEVSNAYSSKKKLTCNLIRECANLLSDVKKNTVVIRGGELSKRRHPREIKRTATLDQIWRKSRNVSQPG